MFPRGEYTILYFAALYAYSLFIQYPSCKKKSFTSPSVCVLYSPFATQFCFSFNPKIQFSPITELWTQNFLWNEIEQYPLGMCFYLCSLPIFYQTLQFSLLVCLYYWFFLWFYHSSMCVNIISLIPLIPPWYSSLFFPFSSLIPSVSNRIPHRVLLSETICI